MKHVCLLSRLALAIVVICVQVNDVAAGKKKSKKEGIEQQEQDQKIKLVQEAADKVVNEMDLIEALVKVHNDKRGYSKLSEILKKEREMSKFTNSLFLSFGKRIEMAALRAGEDEETSNDQPSDSWYKQIFLTRFILGYWFEFSNFWSNLFDQKLRLFYLK